MSAVLIERLRAADPNRLAMALLAPPPARPRLLALYALNDELARTPLAARDPLVAEMRVRWWADRLAAMADAEPPPHELLTPVWDAWGRDAARLVPLAEARVHDAAREPFADAGQVIAYADATGGALMVLAAAAVSSGAPALAVAGVQGRGAALVAWMRARSALQGLGLGLATPGTQVLRTLGAEAQAALAQAAAARRQVPRALGAVLFPGPGVRGAIAAALRGLDPLPASDFARRAALARLAVTGRWWL